MAITDARFMAFDANYLKDDEVANQHKLQVFLNATGALEADANGINVSALGITNGMLAGSIAFTKLADADNIARLDQAETIAAVWDFGANIPQVSGTPDSDNDVTNKAYVDSVAQGLVVKDPVRVVQATEVATASKTGLPTIDGIGPLTDGDRILLINQGDTVASDASENGIWVVHSGAWTRPDDFNTGDNAASVFTFCQEGTVYADTGWVCTTDTSAGDVIDTDDLAFAQFSGAGQVTAGAGLTKSGNTLNVGQNSTGAITVNADDIALSYDSGVFQINGTDPGLLDVKAGGIDETHLSSSVAGNGLTGGGGSALAVATTATGALTISADSVAVSVDSSTIGVTGTGPGQLYVPNGGITETQLNASVAGDGLTGGAGSPLAVGAGNGISVTANAVAVDPSALITGGAAEIDGDKLDIDWNPTYYVPATDPAEVDSLDNLTAHLYGIDQALGAKHKSEVYKKTLNATDISNKYILLPHDTSEVVTPYDEHVRLFVKSGGYMEYGDDYTVVADSPTATDVSVSWSGLWLDGILESGDKLTVYYDIIG